MLVPRKSLRDSRIELEFGALESSGSPMRALGLFYDEKRYTRKKKFIEYEVRKSLSFIREFFEIGKEKVFFDDIPAGDLSFWIIGGERDGK